MDRRLLEIGQVHGNLGLPANQKSCGLDETQPACGKTNRLRDLLGDVNIRGVEKNVVCDKKLASPHHTRTGTGMQPRFAKVRLARGIGSDLIANAFELSTADVLEVLPFGRSGRGFIEINRNLVPLPNLVAYMACHGDAVFNANAFNWNERYDVGRSQPRMCALMLV